MKQVPADSDKRSVLRRIFSVLDAFAGEDQEQTISSLCVRTGLPPATTHRILADLVEWGAVERTSRGHYRLGMRLWRLGWSVPSARSMRDIARPFLVDLHQATGELVALGSRDGDSVIIADLIGGRSALHGAHPPRRMPLTRCAPGLVLLAHLPGDELNEYLARRFESGGGREEFALRKTLGDIRRHGIAVTRGDRDGALGWIAAPIFDGDGGIRAAVGVVAPRERIATAAMAPPIVEAALGISRWLGSRRRVHQEQRQYA